MKGRISRSLLKHRGIDIHGAVSKTGLFVTVAVKMLQGTVDVLKYNTICLSIRPRQTAQTHTRLLLKKQSGQGLSCLLF